MRRFIYKLIFITSCLVSKSGTSIGQVSNAPYREVSISTPNAASLGKYADVPVSKHTGIPDISVPVYTVSEGTIQLPISVSYHAGGLKVMEPASWTGAGWSLNAGGVISRTVQGTPDERWTSVSNAEQMKGHLSDGGYSSYLWQENPTGGPKTYLKEINNGNSDGEPDLFFFNFAGYSGKFYFGDDKIPVVLPEQDIKIEYNYTPGLYKSIESFILTTPDGTKYYFGVTPAANDVDPVERVLPVSFTSGYGHDGKSISSWYLNKAESFDGKFSVTLSYEAESYGYHTISEPLLPYDFTSSNISGGTLNKMLVDGVRLSRINCSNNKVINFKGGQLREDLSGRIAELGDDNNQQAKSLAEIEITDNGLLCKKYLFNYDYFIDNITNLPNCGGIVDSDRKRLKLLSIQEKSCDGAATVPPYQFEYFSEFVPRRINFNQDHWGFYNGANNSQTFIPTIYQNGFYERPGADRDAKWPSMRGGTLKKITYPTGGTSEFEFEPNTTWVSYNKYDPVYAFTTTVGYSGTNSSSTNQYLENLNYKITISNAACQFGHSSCIAELHIFDANNNLIWSAPGVEGGQSKTEYINIPAAGTYKIVMYKNNPVSGYGASAIFTKLVPMLYEANEIVGGLRVKSVKTSSTVQNMQTDYTYDVNGVSSGILYSRPSYVLPIKNSGTRYWYQFLQANGANFYMDAEVSIPDEYPYFAVNAKTAFMSAGGVLPMQTTQGNHIGYNEVKVSNTNNGYSIYRFYGSNTWDADHSDVAKRNYSTAVSTYNNDPEYPAAPFPFEYKRGELKYEGHFNESGKLLKEANYLMTYVESPVTTPGIRVYSEYRNGPIPSYLSVKTDFELHSSRLTERTVIAKQFNELSNQYITSTSTTKFENPLHAQATSQAMVNSKGEDITSKMKYAFDFSPPGCSLSNTCWDTYQSALQNNLSLYGQEYNACTTDDCKKLAKAMLNSRNMAARRDYSSCRINSMAAFEACFQNAKANAGTELKPIYELRQNFINSPIELTSWNNNRLTAATFNKFDYAPNSSGIVYPVKTQKINLAAPSASFTPAAINGTGLTKDNRYEDEVSVKIDNGNLVEKTGKDGVTAAYIWGYNNTLPLVKAIGTDAATLLAAYNAVNGNLLLLRNQPSLSAAFITTYEYIPGVGMKMETDPAGRNTYYDYDKLNRLILVRDHDKNIIKKICYNYAGQPEDCNTPCLNTTPDWQNTATPYRCQQDAWGNNNGYVEYEQKDMNACSPTYNQLRWDAVLNEDICPAAIAITSNNTTGLAGYFAEYTSLSTAQVYLFRILQQPHVQSIGSLPAGHYRLKIFNPAGGTTTLTFGSGCSGSTAITGVSALFPDIVVNGMPDCNAVTINN